MNITDLIVEFVKQGNTVEFPGMGTLSSSTVGAHHDKATGTFYPSRRTLVMSDKTTGNKDIIAHIADKECVSESIAEQMWNNYVSALSDKLDRNPAGHEFGKIGTLRRTGSKVVFDVAENLDLDGDTKHETPLENVATYTPKSKEDPFAAFEKPKPAPQAEPKPAEQPAQEKQPAGPAPKPIEKPAEKPAEKPMEELKPIEAVKPIETVVLPTEEKIVEPQPINEPASQVENETGGRDLSEVKRMLDEIPSSPKNAKEARRAQKAAEKAEKAAAKAAKKAKKHASKKEAAETKERERLAREHERNVLRDMKEKENERKTEKKRTDKSEKEEGKKSRWWLWLLLLLLLCAIAGGVYYYMTQMRDNAAHGSCAQDVELSYCDQFTGDRALLRFGETDIRDNVGMVHAFMADYLHDFLAMRHYSNAFAPMMSRMDEYANERLHELMVEGYCVKRFFPYKDFWMDLHYDEYKANGAHYYRCIVQSELMNIDLLDNLLDELVVTLGLHADGYGAAGQAARAAAAAAAAKAKNDKPYEEVVPEAPTFKNSKQGFDIVAGFFTSKKSANKCANQLKALGSDAYIISKAGGYYVSMGSAPTRTAAEAMEKHIKSWYKSDVKIYNFNE